MGKRGMRDRPVTRGSFEFCPPWMVEGEELEATSGEQGVTISVTEEKAVDSYNSYFTCAAVLPRADAERLRDWLIEVLG